MKLTIKRERLLRQTLARYQKELLNPSLPYKDIETYEKHCIAIMDLLGMEVNSFHRHVPARTHVPAVQLDLFDFTSRSHQQQKP